ncbi:hypothetical protein IW140_004040 [Coemansia sp. RSA 1813]|nr:hypothetical protein EV178_003080 [Coemansia sp. RSA 1646]KAJ1770364.1 hypothetical protein LPJ74_003243 [Coemansia sp. RSA 1843]KAJ2089424.1 hypothetical protein IW138_003454 [Coemansia sp. RSA 986]KAJ2214939.1 hypothetical protein EV179_002614 [Coemansia sp. RSA 487]KAJ2568222.1 hypothetical protein IW140_004040 [Coemansia sp. RSA 1813]
MDHPREQHTQIRDALSAALASKPFVAQEAFLKFPGATEEVDENKKSALKRFRSLSISAKERTAWTEETVKRKYPAEKTVELYEFSSDFETVDLNQMLEPYQHNRSERGGYRIKWLDDTRALAVFRRVETALRVLDDLKASPLVKTRNYAFQPNDLALFNRKYSNDNEGVQQKVTSNSTSTNASETASPYPAFDEEHIRYKYRPEVTVELHDFPCPLETTDLQKLFTDYKREDNIVRIKWFNRNRALAWFTNPKLASEALEDLKTCELVHARPYIFDPLDMKYFNPDQKLAEISSGGLTRRRTISGGSGLARRNTVSGASHYHRGHLYASGASSATAAVAAVVNASATGLGSVPLIPSALGAGASAIDGSQAAGPMPALRKARRPSKANN